MHGKNIVLSLLSLFLFVSMAFAQSSEHIVVAPQCLIKDLPHYQTLSSTKALVLIAVDDDGIEQLIAAKSHKKPCGGFMDVTDAWKEFNSRHLNAPNNAAAFLSNYSKPAKKSLRVTKKGYVIRYEKEVNQLLGQLNPQDMWADLTKLTSFQDRYARSDNGVAAANWIKDQVETMAKNNNCKDVTVTLIKTGTNFKQPSVVAKIGSGSEPGIVIGGHMDTLSSMREHKPGADDDGTGTVTVLEIARILFSSNLQFKKPIYLVWYAAEELGLIGSQYVVSDFKHKNIPVDAVMQLDMTGYAYKNEPTIWLIDDYVDTDLTAFLELLVKTYVKQPVKHTSCGYACSDHATWHNNGFAASMPFEASMGHDNPYIHTSRDTMDLLSLNHMTDYAKLALAFAVELAEPSS